MRGFVLQSFRFWKGWEWFWGGEVQMGKPNPPPLQPHTRSRKASLVPSPAQRPSSGIAAAPGPTSKRSSKRALEGAQNRSWEIKPRSDARLSGPIRANRFAIPTRIANILSESILASRKTSFLGIDLPKIGIAARIGRESREFQCESERRGDSRESGQVLQK